MKKILFIDRDGTLIKEAPPTYQVDSWDKLEFYPEAFFYMKKITEDLDYALVMITNQDGLGSASFPQASFDVPHQFMLDAFSSQGIEFDAVLLYLCSVGQLMQCGARANARVDDIPCSGRKVQQFPQALAFLLARKA